MVPLFFFYHGHGQSTSEGSLQGGKWAEVTTEKRTPGFHLWVFTLSAQNRCILLNQEPLVVWTGVPGIGSQHSSHWEANGRNKSIHTLKIQQKHSTLWQREINSKNLSSENNWGFAQRLIYIVALFKIKLKVHEYRTGCISCATYLGGVLCSHQ